MQAETLLWRRLDRPGHEAARLVFHPPFWQLGGTAVYAEAGEICRIEYQVTCDAEWLTLHADLRGWAGSRRIARTISVSSRRSWRMDGRECPEVEGCFDLDLGFTPATNLIAVRRLALAVGESGSARAAWLGLPEGALEPLEQLYRRTGPEQYHYEAGGAFAADLEVTSAGFVTRYPGRWEREELE